MVIHKGTVVGTMGGTILSVVHSLSAGDIGRTVVLGAIGAGVSFFVSMFLRWTVGLARSKLTDSFQKKKQKKRKRS